jgi:hypothetical protein
MRAGEAYVGQWVVYRPHPDADAEDGEVTEVREAGMVLVRYRGDRHAKSTHVRDLTPGGAP